MLREEDKYDKHYRKAQSQEPKDKKVSFNLDPYI